MKIELKPINEVKKPKYAAMLAALASAALLTGCQTGGEVATEGNIAAPPNVSSNDLEIAGDEQWYPDSSNIDDAELSGTAQQPPDDEVVLMGDEPVDSLPPESSWCELEGDVVLEGEMMPPKAQELPEVIPDSTSETVCSDLIDQSDRLTSDREEDFDMIAAKYAEIIGLQADFIRPVVTVDGMEMLSAGYFPDRPCLFFWFTQDDVTQEWLDHLLQKTPYTAYDWGLICEGTYDGQSCPIVLLSADRGEMAPEDAAKIAEDVLS